MNQFEIFCNEKFIDSIKKMSINALNISTGELDMVENYPEAI